MREVLDGGEIEVVPTPEKVREDRNDKSTFNSSPPDVSRAREGESRGTPETEQDSASESESSDESDSDHPKSSRPFAPRPPQRKEWELNVKSKIAKFISIVPDIHANIPNTADLSTQTSLFPAQR